MEDHEHGVECITESLVREYLTRKGFKTTLNTFDEELAEGSHCITNRAVLINELRLEKLIKKNRSEAVTFRTIFEVIINNLLETFKRKKNINGPVNNIFSDFSGKLYEGNAQIRHKLQSSNLKDSSKHNRLSFVDGHIAAQKTSSLELRIREKNRKIKGQADSSEINLSINGSKITPNDQFCKEINFSSTNFNETKSKTKSIGSTLRTMDHQHNFQTNSVPSDLEVYDISDEDTVVVDRHIPYSPPVQSAHVEAIADIQITELRTLLFGNVSQTFSPEWREQNFSFNDIVEISYGLVQKKGGPCGFLAVIQGFILKNLLYGSNTDNLIGSNLRPSMEAKNYALLQALASILWKCGKEKRSILALPSMKIVVDSVYPHDGFIECLVLHYFYSYQNLFDFLRQVYIEHLDTPDCCIGFLYSAILSRGINKVKKDMDDPQTTLVGRHNYCTQEMVNLLLIGKAVSNVFDGEMELNSGGKDIITLKGIPFRSELGLLSLFEHYDSCKVGNYLKNPKYPIWIVLSESHFTILFTTLDDLDDRGRFDLFYYDGLAHQTEEIRLTINLNRHIKVKEADKDEMTPPIEHCIRTKWPTAHISWNKTEPLL